MTRRMNQHQRQKLRRQRTAEVERDAGMLPTDGPIADLIARISAELDRCIIAGRGSVESVPFLQPFGPEAFASVGSIRGLRALSWKASNIGRGRPEARRDMLDKAWHGVGDERGVWAA